MVKLYSFFNCIFSHKEKCLLGHTFRIWYNQSPGPNAVLRGKHIQLAMLHLILVLTPPSAFSWLLNRFFLAVIFNSLKLPIFPPCRTTAVFSSWKAPNSCWMLLAGMQALKVRARQGVQQSTQPQAPEQSSQAMQQAVSGQARGPSHPTQPMQCLVKHPDMPFHGQSAYWPTCPHPYPPLPLPGRFQRHVYIEQYEGSSGNYFSCQFFLQFMGTSCSSQGASATLKFPLFMSEWNLKRRYWLDSVC